MIQIFEYCRLNNYSKLCSVSIDDFPKPSHYPALLCPMFFYLSSILVAFGLSEVKLLPLLFARLFQLCLTYSGEKHEDQLQRMTPLKIKITKHSVSFI